ncbi:MAG: oligosaccharide flippase family protein [Olegusella sp.]|nr:oligosaccharide flippase family protein [Olegusella sp.]
MNKRRAGALMSYAYSAAQIVVNLIYVPLLLSGVGNSEYGLYQMIGSIIAYLNVINSTLSAGATRYYSKYYVLGDEDNMANTLGILKRIYRWANIIIAAATAVLIFAFRIVYARSFTPWEIEESSLLLIVLAFNLIVTMNNTISIAVITAHEEFVFLKATMLATVVIQPILVVFAIRLFPYALTVSIVQLAMNTVCRTLQHEYARRKLGMDTKLRNFNRELQNGILRFSGTIAYAAMADQIFWKTDQLILGYMYGTSSVAVYAVGSQIVNAYMPLGTAVSSVFLPRVSELWHKDHDLDAISALFTKVSRIAIYPLLAVLTGFIVFGQGFIKLWAGDGYQAAYWVAIIELTPFTIDVMQNIGLTVLQVMNRYGFRAKMYLVSAILNIGLTVVLAYEFGIVGAAWASGIAMAISSGIILNWYYAKRVGLHMGAYWKSVAREIVPMLALCAIGVIAWRAMALPVSWHSLIAGIIGYAIAFTLVAYFACTNAYEKTLINTGLRRVSLRR